MTSPTLIVGKSCRKKNLTACTCYEFRVRAASAWGWSGHCDPVMVVTLPSAAGGAAGGEDGGGGEGASTSPRQKVSNHDSLVSTEDGCFDFARGCDSLNTDLLECQACTKSRPEILHEVSRSRDGKRNLTEAQDQPSSTTFAGGISSSSPKNDMMITRSIDNSTYRIDSFSVLRTKISPNRSSRFPIR